MRLRSPCVRCWLQGAVKALSKAYHKVDVRQKLVQMCRQAGEWIIHLCSRVHAVDVYTVAHDMIRRCPMVYHVLTTSQGRLVACDNTLPAVRHNDNLFLSVSLPGLLSIQSSVCFFILVLVFIESLAQKAILFCCEAVKFGCAVRRKCSEEV